MSTSTTVKTTLIYKEPPTVRLAICYNPFLPSDLARHELVYEAGKTLAEYLNGLPEEVQWNVAYNSVPVEPEAFATTIPVPGSIITIVRVPEGGHGGGKAILRLVALLAVVAFAAFAAPYLVGAGDLLGLNLAYGTEIAVAQAAVSMVGSLVVNALLPAQQINTNTGPQSTSYSIDGPKNTAREGQPVPVIYGTMRVGGNICDLFTRNIGDDQYLFMRTILNDGEVDSITSLQLNGQDIANFKDVEYRVNYGAVGETPVNWFNEATRLNQVQQKIDQTGVLYTTSGSCDRVRVDVSFPLGLIATIQKSGNVYTNEVDLAIDYRLCDSSGTPTGSWTSLPLDIQQPLTTAGGAGIYNTGSTNHAYFSVTPNAPSTGTTWSVEAQYKRSTDSVWVSAGVKTGAYQATTNFAAGGYSYSTGLPLVQWDISFPSVDLWQIRFIGGSVQDNTTANPNLNSTTQNNVPGTVPNLKVVRKTTSPFHLTYESSTLMRGRYQIRVTRSDLENPDVNKPTQCWVTDVAEIDNQNVSYAGVAMVSLKIKLTDQLSSQPTLTALVGGSKLKIYDADGNVTSTAYSNNPADIVMDMLLNTTRGGAGDPTKVVWTKVAEFRWYR